MVELRTSVREIAISTNCWSGQPKGVILWRVTITAQFAVASFCRVTSSVKSGVDRSRDAMCFRLRRDVIVRCRSPAKRRNEHQTPLSSAQSAGTSGQQRVNSTGSENCLQTSQIGPFEAEVYRSRKTSIHC